MKKKLSVIVCGTRFGQFYLEALRKSDEFELVGILARGSHQSRLCAEKYATTLYTDPNELPKDIDMACVVVKTGVMGGKGTDLSIELMKRGMHVILEQPIHSKDIQLCYKEAIKNKVKFFMGDLYLNLFSSKKLIKMVREIRKGQDILYINIDMASQLLFPLIALLYKSMGPIKNWKIKDVINGDIDIPFQVLTMSIDNIPVSIRVQNQVDKAVSDNYMHLMYQITFGFPGGRLSLVDTHGPLIWQPRLTIPNYKFIPSDLTVYKPANIVEENMYIVGDYKVSSYEKILTETWPESIYKDLLSLREFILDTNTHKKMLKNGNDELICSKIWHDVSNALGYPHIVENCRRNYLAYTDLDNMYYKDLSMSDKYNELSEDHIVRTKTQLDKVSLISIMYTLQSYEVFTNTVDGFTVERIFQMINIADQNKYIVRRWIQVLIKYGYILEKNSCYYSDTPIIKKDDFQAEWNEARRLWNHKLGEPAVLEYFYTNAVSLSGLLEGSISATLLLFDKGKNDIANSLYRRTIIAWYLNQRIADNVVNKYKEMKDNLKILEVGGGTGSTTKVVINSLIENYNQEITIDYLFSDLSNFFLKDAEKTYKDIPWFRTGMIDIEKNLRNQGVKNKKDIIIAAGVLNNVDNIVSVLKELKEYLSDDGILIISEAVEESLQILISQVFMMNDASDIRKDSDSTFMLTEQWNRAFELSGLKTTFMAPNSDNKLRILGQKVFVLKKIYR